MFARLSACVTDDYDPKLETFDRIAKWGGGTSVMVDFNSSPSMSKQPNHAYHWTRIAPAATHATSERAVFRQTLKTVLDEGYRDRVEPFVTILMEFAEMPVKEYRESFKKVTPGKSRPQKNRQLDR